MNYEWAAIGASVLGVSHKLSAIACQDANGWHIDSNTTCLAVADGAGSRPHSAEGASACIEAVLGLVSGAAKLTPSDSSGWSIPTIFHTAHRRICELAQSLSTSVDDFATTLAVVYICDGVVRVGQVGDGIVVLEKPAGEIVPVSPPPKYEYVNEVDFLTAPDWANNLRSDEFNESDTYGIALSTDGLRLKILEEPARGQPYLPFFQDIFSYARGGSARSDAIAEFIEALDDQTGDDKTLVVATRSD